MRPCSSSSDDVCRARYDRLLFAAERCRAGPSSRDIDHGASVPSLPGDAAALPVHMAGRKRLLELGAMSVLEAELELLPLGENSGRREGAADLYKSCLVAMLDGHYDALGEDSIRSICTCCALWATRADTRVSLNLEGCGMSVLSCSGKDALAAVVACMRMHSAWSATAVARVLIQRLNADTTTIMAVRSRTACHGLILQHVRGHMHNYDMDQRRTGLSKDDKG